MQGDREPSPVSGKRIASHDMKVKLTPDKDISVKKLKIGHVPTLVLKSAGDLGNDIGSETGILWIHGGGYIAGMKEMVYMSRALDLVKKYGVTVFSPGYRLAWIHPFPAAFEDCYAVLEYMDTHRQEYGFSRIIVGGESAGGGLAAAICMAARDRSVRVDYQLPLYPMISNLDTESSRDNHGKVWNTRRNHLGWRMYLRKDAKKTVSPYASALQQTDYRNLPPCYTFVGDGEPFYAETLQYVENLKNAGVEAEADVYHTNVHAFDMLWPEDSTSRKAVEAFNKYLEKVFRK